VVSDPGAAETPQPPRPSSARQRRAEHPASYSAILALLVAEVLVTIGAGTGPVWLFVSGTIQLAVLVAIVEVTQTGRLAPTWVVSVATATMVAALALAFANGGNAGTTIIRFTQIVFTVASIGLIVNEVRSHIQINLRTASAALVVYLQFGLLFAYLLAFMASVRDAPVLGGAVDGVPGDYVYFSFVTLTTTGYGDITAITQPARALAIAEALLGQIYLVTVVGLVVGNLGASRRSPGSDDHTTAD
jgi:hypothetical protein